jgi:hypothetical protein
VNAATSVLLNGVTLTRATGDAKVGDSANASKNWEDANIQISPTNASNAVGTPHILTGHVNVNDGTGFVNAPVGTVINFSVVSGPGALSAPSCATVLLTGSCSVTLTSATPGVTVVNASTSVVLNGVTLNRSTGDAHAGDSANANKAFVDANIQISPTNASNAVGTPHVLTGHVNVNDGTGFVNAPVGTVINFSVVSGTGTLSAPSCSTVGGTGSCTDTLTSSVAGNNVITATTTVTITPGNGIPVTLTRSTGDANAGDSVNANKTFVDANIQISPPSAFNEIGTPHVLTGHVNVNDGSGYVNAPAGTTITFSIVSGPGALSAPSCATLLATGSCSVTLTSGIPGVTTVNASTTVVVNGVTLNRATGDAKAGDSANASKTFVDANIQISPQTATNPVGTNHTLTGHVNVNDGTGYVNAPAGTTITFSIVSGPGALSAPTCATVLATGSCSVTLTSGTVGTTVINASTTVVVNGVTLTRSTGDSHVGDSPNAQKIWTPRHPTITTTPSATQVPAGIAISDSATVDADAYFPGAGTSPDGTVSFTLFGPFTSAGVVTCTGTPPVAAAFPNISPTTSTQGSATYNSPTTSPSAGGVYAWVATYNGNPNNTPVTSGCTAELVTVTPSGVIAPTGTTCTQFITVNHDDPSIDLDQVHYTVSGGTISQGINPGVFFYYTKFSAPAAGSLTVNINQVNSQSRPDLLFGVLQAPATSQVQVFNSDCTAFSGTAPTITFSGTNSSQVQLSFTGLSAGQTIIVSVKYTTKSIAGALAPNPPTVHYDFSTGFGSTAPGTIVDTDPGGLDLVTP